MSNQRQGLILEGSIGTAVLRLSLPIMIGNLLQAGYQLTDAFWVGHLGAAAVAAVSVGFPVMFLVIGAGAGFAMAGAALAAQYAGAGRQDMVNHVAAQTMVMVAFVSIVFGAFGYVASPFLLRVLGVAPDVFAGALGFMRVSFVGIIFVFFYAMFQALMRSVGQMRMPVLIVLGTVLLNFALDPLFIFGWGPIASQGVLGAAVATLVTQCLASVIALAVLLRGAHGIHLTWGAFRPDFSYIRRAFVLGLPASVELLARGVGPMAMSFLAAGFGTLTLAAYGVGTTLLQFATIPAMSLSMAVSILVGQNMGAGNIERAERSTRVGGCYSFAVLTLMGGAAFLGATSLVAFFVPHDDGVIRYGAQFTQVMCLSWGGIGIQLCIAAAFRSSGMMRSAMAVALFSQMFQFALAFVLSRPGGLGEAGLWWSFPIASVAVGLFSIAWFGKGGWKNNRLTEAAA